MFRKNAPEPDAAVLAGWRAAVPAAQLVVAVGDIHGRLDLLEALWRQVDAAGRSTSARTRTLVFLGDYIDRGPDSAEVVSRLIEGFAGFDALFLMGNHEETLLQFLDDPSVGATWSRFGGLDTLASYGIAHRQGDDWAETRHAFSQALPRTHLAFFKNLRLQASVGDYLFVHAGVRPYVPLDAQKQPDLLWIRDEFLESDARFGPVVVHGHTPGHHPVLRPNRIGIDTGAYFSGTLTAVMLEGREVRFLST